MHECFGDAFLARLFQDGFFERLLRLHCDRQREFLLYAQQFQGFFNIFLWAIFQVSSKKNELPHHRPHPTTSTTDTSKQNTPLVTCLPIIKRIIFPRPLLSQPPPIQKLRSQKIPALEPQVLRLQHPFQTLSAQSENQTPFSFCYLANPYGSRPIKHLLPWTHQSNIVVVVVLRKLLHAQTRSPSPRALFSRV